MKNIAAFLTACFVCVSVWLFSAGSSQACVLKHFHLFGHRHHATCNQASCTTAAACTRSACNQASCTKSVKSGCQTATCRRR